jgi:surface carbohydrate biosynthesis protein (TIGR04326 family)
MRTLWVVGGIEGLQPDRQPNDVVVYWDKFSAEPGTVSLATRLDDRFEALQARFVDWRDTMAAADLKGRTLSSHLDLGVPGGGSLWWSTTVAATPPETLDRVASVLKLLLLEEIAAAATFSAVRYDGDDARLARVLENWCNSQRHSFTWNGRPAPRGAFHLVRATRYLLSFLKKRAQMPAKSHATRSSDVAIVTYFPNVVDEAVREGKFESRYWGPLHKLIDGLGLKVRWIWFHSDAGTMTIADAVAFRDSLNEPRAPHTYEFLEEHWQARHLFASLRLFCRLAWLGFCARRLESRFRCAGSSISFFPLLEDEWRSSFHGAHAMFMAIYAVAFRNAFVADHPKRLLYVWENQSWEFLLLDAWKRSQTGPAIAVAHTANCSSPMLLRNRIGRNQQESVTRLGPDCLVAIGAPAAKALRDFGWPPAAVTEAEALRYDHLNGAYRSARRAVPDTGRQLLVLTGISRTEAEWQVRLLAEAAAHGGLRRYGRIVFKAHPFCPVNAIVAAAELTLPHSVVTTGLGELLVKSDVVLSGSGTSASTEVSWYGVPQVLIGAQEGLNLSPLRAIPNVRFVVTAPDLAEQLDSPMPTLLDQAYFRLDPELPRWRSILQADRNAFVA